MHPEHAKLLKVDEEMTARKQAGIPSVIRILQEHKDKKYTFSINLKNMEANGETANYGDITVRRLSLLESIEVQSNPFYQKAMNADVMLAQGRVPPDMTEQDMAGLFELWCGIIAKASDSGITKESLMSMGNWGYCRFVFGVVCELSGIGSKVAEDFAAFFRDGPGSDTGSPVRQVGTVPE